MLNHYVAIRIPGTVFANISAPSVQNEFVDKAARLFAEAFGGFEIREVKGGWVSKETGSLIKEPIVVVSAYSDDDRFAPGLEKVREFAYVVRMAMSQEAVAVEYDGKMEFVESEPVAIAA